MKLLKPFSLVILLLLPCAAISRAQTAPSAPAQPSNQASNEPSGQAPDEMIKKLSDLVHAGRYDEARQSVAGLLILYPDDQRLVKARALLDKAPAANGASSAQPSNSSADAPTNGASTTAAQPAATDPAAQLKGMDRVDYDALLELAHQAQQTSDLIQQKALLQQFMNQSGPFVQHHPEQTLLWQLRAAAALSLNDPDEGYNAAQKLLAAGAADTNDANLLRLMAQLKNKNWLDAQGVAEAKARIAEDKKYGWIVGTWSAVDTWFQKAAFDYGKRQNNLKIEFVRSGDVVLGYAIHQDTGRRYSSPIFQYTIPVSGKPDASSWSFNLGTPPKWQPVESFTMDNGGNTFELNMKYQQTKFVLNKVADSASDSASADAQAQLPDSSAILPGKKSKKR
jgi:hypothetical protein